jgi:two-component system, cell cycle sensor histidine kinase and response regulator CckA
VILVAEDDVVVRNLVNRILTRAGYLVLVACDGVEATEVSARYAGEIDLLISDVTMPRLGGVQLVTQLRASRPGLKALLISGRTSSEVTQGNRVFDFLAKPFLPADLTARIARILAAAPGAATDPSGGEIETL